MEIGDLKPIDQSEFERLQQSGSSMSQRYFSEIIIHGNCDAIDFSESRFMDCRFEYGSFQDANFSNCTINADGRFCNFARAKFTGADIYWGNYRFNKYHNADFSTAHLRHCFFTNCSFFRCKMHNVLMDSTDFRHVAATSVKGLETLDITMGGATEQEVNNLRQRVMEALAGGEKNRNNAHVKEEPER